MKTLVTLVTGLVLVVVMVLGVAAQDGTLAGLVQPLVVSIEQAVPVDVTLAVEVDGEVITVTTPITVAVAMQVKLDGAAVAAVTGGESKAPVVAVTQEETAAGALVDGAGLTLEVTALEGVTVDNVTSSVNALDMLEIIGEITNDGGDPLKSVQLIATLYDAAGAMLGVDTGYASVKEIAPGQTSPFKIMSMTAGADVASYRLQVQP
jgi:hypothetical protein